MKYTILLLIIFLNSCVTIECKTYFYYSQKHDEQTKRTSTFINPYKPKYVNGIKYTEKSPKNSLKLYKDLWGDPEARIVFVGCPDTLKLTMNP